MTPWFDARCSRQGGCGGGGGGIGVGMPLPPSERGEVFWLRSRAAAAVLGVYKEKSKEGALTSCRCLKMVGGWGAMCEKLSLSRQSGVVVGILEGVLYAKELIGWARSLKVGLMLTTVHDISSSQHRQPLKTWVSPTT